MDLDARSKVSDNLEGHICDRPTTIPYWSTADTRGGCDVKVLAYKHERASVVTFEARCVASRLPFHMAVIGICWPRNTKECQS